MPSGAALGVRMDVRRLTRASAASFLGTFTSCSSTATMATTDGAMSATSGDKRTRVAIVGAGASGMAAAWSLSRYPDRYTVDVFEPCAVPGGVACTLDHNGAPVNYGVQGGNHKAHQNT